MVNTKVSLLGHKVTFSFIVLFAMLAFIRLNAHASLNTDLIAAVMNKDLLAVKKSLKEGANVNTKAASNGATPLMIACQLNEYDIVKYLIESGADVKLQADNGGTPIYAAAAYADLSIVAMLIAKGAEVNQMSGGMTPLFIAAQRNKTETVIALLDAGADPNIKATNGATALMQAAKHGNEHMASAVLKKGASLSPKVKGWTALKIAKSKGHHEIVKLLINATQRKP